VQDLYFIEGQLSQEMSQQLALKLLSDPVTQDVSWIELPSPLSKPEDDSVILEVALRPGVTDPVAEQIVRAAHELGFNLVGYGCTTCIGNSGPLPEAISETIKKNGRRKVSGMLRSKLQAPPGFWAKMKSM